MKKIFNTIFENSTRVLLILYPLRKPISSDMVAILDFITLYSGTLGIGGKDLNGQNSFAFCEYMARQSIIKEGIKNMSVYGLIDIHKTTNGFCYTINNKGKEFVQSLTSNYKTEYLQNLKVTLNFTKNKKEKTLISFINEKTNKGDLND